MYEDVGPGLLGTGVVAGAGATGLLPFTGTEVITFVLLAFGLLVAGLLLIRAGKALTK
jgi:hypothetical protein